MKYKVLYTFAYMAIGAFTPFIGPYLKSLGFSGSDIGMVTATGTTVAIAAVAFWGGIYSRRETRSSKSLLLAGLCVGAIVFALCLKAAVALAFVLLFYALIYFMQPPSISLIDSLTVLSAGTKAYSTFGSKRAWGAVGFALGVFVGGRIASLAGVGSVFYIYIGCFLITAVTLILISREGEPESAAQEGDAASAEGAEQGDAAKSAAGAESAASAEAADGAAGTYRKLLSDKRVRQLLICMFFMGGTNVANNTYFSFLYIEGGGTLAGVGIVMLLMVGSEVPFMAWCDRLAERFTMQKTILAAMLISSARFILYGVGLPWWMLVVLFATQGAVNGIILVEFVRYISRLAPRGCESLAVSAYYVIGSNISTIVCQYIGGLLLDGFSAAGVYMFFGLFNLVGTILYVVFGLHKA